MNELLTAASIRRLEAAALAALPGGILMARAAEAVAEATARLARTLEPGRPVLALVGPGNNGGDALLAALRLRERGYACRAIALRPAGASHGDAGEAWRAARTAGLRIDGVEALREALEAAPIAIDGLFGIGLDRALDGPAAALCGALREARVPVVAVDVPSGIDADSGAIVGGPGAAAVRAVCTVTMIADKPGLHTGAALDHAGTVQVAGLGLEAQRAALVDEEMLAHRQALTGEHALLHERTPAGGRAPGAGPGLAAGRLFGAAQAAAALPRRARDSHKGSYGAVLAYGGDTGTRGAVLLAARGAQALGAGKVFVATPAGELFDPGQPQLMTADGDAPFDRFDVVVIGCGLGTSARAHARLAAALAQARALVLDADALNLMAADATLATAGVAGLREGHGARRVVMTPHPLEAARLLGCDATHIQADRRGAALELARRFGAVALLKGAGSIVATPEGAWAVVDAGGPALATAGTGDVLAGMIGARLAQGDDAADAACVAAWLHGRAATMWEAARGHAEGLSAAELPALAREVLGTLAA